jgi:hypothetical protein
MNDKHETVSCLWKVFKLGLYLDRRNNVEVSYLQFHEQQLNCNHHNKLSAYIFHMIDIP